MTPKEQYIAIAEACGWINQGVAKKVPGLEGRWRHPQIRNHFVTTDLLPDYLNDLNAMHEAWNECIRGRASLEDAFTHYLAVACGFDEDQGSITDPNLSVADIAVVSNATAAQRAEAFLRATGRWEDSP